jgi:hypothetical protein
MTGQPDDILDSLFHGCALTAYLVRVAKLESTSIFRDFSQDFPRRSRRSRV